MTKQRILAIEKLAMKRGRHRCPLCWSGDGRRGWIVVVLGQGSEKLDADGRCRRCGAMAKVTICSSGCGGQLR